ncbi:uncharacterized protein LOC128887622 isoform X2 [Hylaeus anthracinus]|uniref:uncharacterized protein LOC128873399 isoform X1 n=1 Tax=Hylaeus volcanicus TaxID=313075 RepID=UPI0023B7F67E|nr:uncharacterized protein LOC128873399 isoform X1 [Hylaeus volcanicus]XP_053999693.1 uncharacterized protein LOC128887622 isoform X2 [Hylaeus anthracinus]
MVGNRAVHDQNSRVRLAMQYPNADIPEGRRVRNVRRRLFQDEEGDNESVSERRSGIEDNLANCFLEEARKNRENAKQRWNFDFEKEEPLPGRYEWIKLDQERNDIGYASESRNRVENLQAMQVENLREDDSVIPEHAEEMDDDNMTDST